MVDSTTLAGRLDPEDLRTVTVGYHAACTAVIQRYGGHMAQYLGEGLLVYFGWPQAHEDDARRAVHAGLALVTAVRDLGSGLVQDCGIRLAVRIGIHTGLVVVGAEEGVPRMASWPSGLRPSGGEDPEPGRARYGGDQRGHVCHLVQGYFVCEPLGEHHLPGMTAPSDLYQVLAQAGHTGVWTSPRRRSARRLSGVRRNWRCSGSGQRRCSRGWGRWCSSVGRRASGNRAWCRKSRPPSRPTALPAIEFRVRRTINTRPCIRSSRGCSALSRTTARRPCLSGWRAWRHLLRQARLDLPENLPLLAALLSLALPRHAIRRCNSPHNSSDNAPWKRWSRWS